MTKEEYKQGIECCELCGRKRKLELHHIVPLTCGGPDIEENWVAICVNCHSRLTPRSILQRIGIDACKGSDRKPIRDFLDRAVNDLDDDGWAKEDWWDVFKNIFMNPEKPVHAYYVKQGRE